MLNFKSFFENWLKIGEANITLWVEKASPWHIGALASKTRSVPYSVTFDEREETSWPHLTCNWTTYMVDSIHINSRQGNWNCCTFAAVAGCERLFCYIDLSFYSSVSWQYSHFLYVSCWRTHIVVIMVLPELVRLGIGFDGSAILHQWEELRECQVLAMKFNGN